MLTIDEAIKHCEEVAEAEERSAKLHQRPDRGVKGSGKRYLSCLECAAEHRQLAEWLRELKEIKHLFSITEKLIKANFRGGLIDVVDGYNILFSEHKQLREIFEEVTADEDSD